MFGKLHLIPVFLAMLVTTIIIFCLVIWRRLANLTDGLPKDDLDPTVWLILGLLLVAVFGLGAFLMYALLHVG
jgi:ABC-type amino acid transport system permease subunit